jgi:mannose-6-phosphate isomerase
MVNPVMPYAWGSRDGIATLQGRAPAAEPEAELWMGAHPRAASVLDGLDQPLDAVIAADPEGVLGGDVVARFGPRLPFMLKVLSAAEPLSLQVHPDDDLAQRGFAAEDAAGIDRPAPGVRAIPNPCRGSISGTGASRAADPVLYRGQGRHQHRL